MTASASSSSGGNLPDLDLLSSPLLADLPRRVVAGQDRDLLAPLGYLAPGEDRLPPLPEVGRRELARALAESNAAYGHPRAEAVAQRLAEPATRVVVTGQQPGVLGGPLYTLTKIIAAGKWAEALEASGAPAVAVFWVASEDHDYAEATRTVLPTPEGPRVFDLGPDPAPLAPLGMRSLGPAVAALFRELREAGQGQRFTGWLETLEGWYRPEAGFGEAFCRLMVHLLGERAPLFVDAMHPVLKEIQRPLLRRLVEDRTGVEEALRQADAGIEERRYPLQVTPQPGASPLFLIRGGQRRRVEWKGEDAFSLRGEEGGQGSPVAELFETIDENPGSVSPGVLARPAVQDGVLGTSLQVVGPGELAYLAQAAALYPVLGVAPPAVTLRPQVLALEARQLDLMAEVGLHLQDLLGEEAALDGVLARRQAVGFVAPVIDRMEELLGALRGPALELDAQLERPWQKTRDQVLRALELFSGKVTASAARRDASLRRRVDALRSFCLPLGELQERVITTAYFPARHGSGFTEALWQQLERDPTRLQVIRP